MQKKKVLVCDDQQIFLDLFCGRHSAHYDVITVLNSRDLMDTIDTLGCLPDMVILDLYFPRDNTKELNNVKFQAAQEQLEILDNQISAAKKAALEVWEPHGIELLKSIRDKYSASELPVVITTRKGLLLLDDDQIRSVEQLDGHWLLKEKLSPLTEKIRIDRIMSRSKAPTAVSTRAAPVRRIRSADAPKEQHSHPTKIFIGHGRSPVWRDLKDFVTERLKLPYDEFNAEPVAGITNVARLSQMLNDAAFGFLVLTAEDEQVDGKMQARMNVIHEVGLFQSRLGFEKAIVLLEESCEEFSNIAGLGQLRFPTGRIGAKFEEIRRVLEREGIIDR